MARLISIPKMLGTYLLESEPELSRMVPVHHYDSTHVWVWALTDKSFVYGPTKIPHNHVKKMKKFLVSPDGAYWMAGKIDPYTYTKGAVYPLDWSPGQEKSKPEKKYVSFAGKKGMPDGADIAPPSLDIPDWEDGGEGPDEDGWIDGEYDGEYAQLSPDGTHIIDPETFHPLWPKSAKPKAYYSIPDDVSPAGKLNAHGLMMFLAHEPEGFEMALLPNGKFGVLNNNEYVVYTRSTTGEMTPTKNTVPVAWIKSKPVPVPEKKPKLEKPAVVKPPEQVKPKIVAIEPKPDPVTPKAVTPDDLVWSEETNELGLFTTSSPSWLLKAPDGIYYTNKLKNGISLYYRMKWSGKKDATDWAAWESSGLVYDVPTMKEKYAPVPKPPPEPEAKPGESTPDELEGFTPLGTKDPYGFSEYKFGDSFKKYSKLPGGWGAFSPTLGKYHVYYVVDPNTGKLKYTGAPPIDPEKAGSESSAAKQNRVFVTKYGELKNGFFADAKDLEPKQAGVIKVYHSNPMSELAGYNSWYQLPNGLIASFSSMDGKYYVAIGSGDDWKAGSVSLSGDMVLGMLDKVKEGPPTPLKSKDAHGFDTVKATGTDGVEYEISKLPLGVYGVYRHEKDTYGICVLDGGKVYFEYENKALPIVVWAGVRALKRKVPVVGTWKVAGIDTYGALILTKGKTTGTVRLLPTGQLARFSAGKFKQAKFDEANGKINLLKKGGMTFTIMQVRKYASKVELGTYKYVGPGAVVDPESQEEPAYAAPAKAAEAGYTIQDGWKVPTGFKIHDEWHNHPTNYISKGEYNAKPVIWANMGDGSVADQLGKTTNMYVSPSGVVFHKTKAGFQAMFFHADGSNDYFGDVISAEELGIVLKGKASTKAAYSLDYTIQDGWPVPAGFKIHDNWQLHPEFLHLSKGEYNAKPVTWVGGAGAADSTSKASNMYLSPKGVVFVKTVSDGFLPLYFKPDGSGFAKNLGDEVSAAELGIEWDGSAPEQKPTTSQEVWNPPSGFETHDDWGTNYKSKQVKKHGYLLKPVKLSSDNSSFLVNASSNKTLFLTPSGTIVVPKAYSNGEEFHPIEWKNGVPYKFGKPKSAQQLGILASPPDVAAATPSAPKQSTMSIPSASTKSAASVDAPTLASLLPDVSDLKFLESGASLKGAGKKDIYVDSQGKKYIFKPAISKSGSAIEPHRAYAQEVSSVLGLAMREDHIPVKAVELDGKIGTIQPFLQLDDPADLSNYPPSKLTDTEKLDVAIEHIMDWIGSQHDSHKANLIRVKGGGVLSIDKEQGFKHWGEDRLSVTYHPNSKFGEAEPYYNTFWKAFASGEIDFDPKQMGVQFDHIAEHLDWPAVEVSLRKYAEQRFKGSLYRQNEFIAQVKTRKNTAKRDFEEFITGLYEMRTGKDGTFTFKEGWKEKGAEGGKVQVKTDVAAWSSLPNKTAVTIPTKSGESKSHFKIYHHENDSSLVTFKIDKSVGLGQLNDVVNTLGIEPVGEPVQGSYYVMIFVRKSDLEKIGTNVQHIDEKLVKVGGIDPHSGVAEYLPETDYMEHAAPNFEQISDIAKSKNLGISGKRLFLDSDVVEGQTATVRRQKEHGKTKTVVSFKLRSGYLSKIKGTPKQFVAKAGSYDDSSDSIDITGGLPLMNVHTSHTRYYSLGSDTIYAFPANSSAYALQGTLVAELDGSPTNIKERLRDLLKGVVPDIDPSRILSEPTEHDRAVLRSWRLLNAVDPKKHDSLLASGGSSEDVVKALKAKKVYSKLADIQEVEILDGQVGHILPDRWKTPSGSDGKPLLRYFFHATSTAANVPLVLRNSLGGATERIAQGSPASGAVNGQDYRTGGADTIQCRVSTASTKSTGLYHGSVPGYIRFIFSPDIADRLDTIFYFGDTYGCTTPDSSSYGGEYRNRRSFQDAVGSFDSKGGTASEEAVFVKGIHSKKCLRVACENETYRTQVLNACDAAGLHEFNGIPIEDFVVVETKQGPVYEKYVKPAGF